MAFQMLILETRQSGADVAKLVKPLARNPKQTLTRIEHYIHGVAVGAYRANAIFRTSAVKATATLTLTGDPSADETFVLCGTTFTAKGSGATGNQFNISAGNATTTAANIAAAVNASATAKVTASVVASSALGVVTFTAIDPGAAGNGYVLTESMSNTTRVDFAGGSDGTETTLAAGGAS